MVGVEVVAGWGSPLPLRDNVFDDVDKSTCVLYVPKGSLSVYWTAPVWMDFWNIEEYEPSTPPTPTIRGDVNGDGVVNVADITEVAKIILTGKAKED